MARKTPTITNNLYEFFDEHEGKITQTLDIEVYPDNWVQHYIKHISSLRVIYTDPKTGFTFKCSFYRKKHKYYKGPGFWYAHKRVKGKMHRKYVGSDTNMTVDTLNQITREMAQLPLPGIQVQLFDPGAKPMPKQASLLRS